MEKPPDAILSNPGLLRPVSDLYLRRTDETAIGLRLACVAAVLLLVVVVTFFIGPIPL
jgi:hypothetical protein